MNKFLIFPILLLVLLTIGAVCAADNATFEEVSAEEISSKSIETPVIENESSQIIENTPIPTATKIETRDVTTYYKQDCELVSYLKDANSQPISNKKVSISINNKVYDKVTDNAGKVVLKLNLKPDSYLATIRFAGDANYTASSTNAVVKVNKLSLAIATKNYKAYWHSDLFFKAKVTNKVTKSPVKGIKVVFKVYSSKNKYKIYYATTDAKGIAKLKKNFNVGKYKVITNIKKSKNIKSKKSKATLTVVPTAEIGCCSFYVQVSNTESVVGFRRDGTSASTMHVVKYKLNGKPAVKQYKKGSYFFHIVSSADGWMAGTGGLDNPSINKAIEKLVGKMFKEGKIKKSYLKTIQRYEKALGLGHFSIKAPNGKYALVWSSAIKTGQLKPGKYISVPNGKSSFRHGTWAKFSKDPAKAAIKVGATDPYGVNRRDLTAFHWKATTIYGKTNSTIKAYAANDNGKLLGRSTGHFKDDIRFKGKFFSKNKLPKAPSALLLGVHNFGSIDKLIKIQTVVKAPKLVKNLNESKTFDITVKNKKTKKAIKNFKLKIKIENKSYSVKTDSKGVAKFNANLLDVGSYGILIYSANNKYYVSAKSTIKII